MVGEFVEIYKEFYKSEVGNSKAREILQNLLNAYKIVYRQPPKMAVSVLDNGDEDGLDS